MEFDLAQAMEILSRTPSTLDSLLRGLPEPWVRSNEGGDTWSPFDIVGHLAHGEETDWITRAKIILEHGDSLKFEPFDRYAQFEKNVSRTLDELLDDFAILRERNLKKLQAMDLKKSDMDRAGMHPELGRVNLGQLLACWVVHDLGHIGQVVRVMSKLYSTEVGPWKEYLRVLQ